ncbi:hypothetical protein YC2023_115182 [Brassica napus]
MLRICFLLQTLPRFQEENLDHNKILYDKVCAMSEKKGCTPAQLALAWVHHQGDDVCPIPGTTKIENLNQNIGALSVKLTPEEMSELETIGQPESVKGERYTAMVPTFKNSDTPPLSSWKATELDHTQVKDLKTTIYLLTPTSPELDVTKPQDMVRPGSLSLLAEAYDRCVQVCAEYAKKIYLEKAHLRDESIFQYSYLYTGQLQEFIYKMRASCTKKLPESSVEQSPVDLSKTLFCLTASILFRVAFGESFHESKIIDQEKIDELVFEGETALASFAFSDFFPIAGVGWLFDLLSGQRKRLNDVYLKLDVLFQHMIDDHLSPQRSKDHYDIIDLMLKVIHKQGKDDSLRFTVDHIKGVLANIFLAGIDTGAITMIWTMTELARNMEVMKKFQEEICDRLGNSKERITEEDIGKFLHLYLVIKETFRLHPTVPLLLPRETMAHIKVQGYDIPPKRRILVNAWAIGRDPKLWINPEEFNPDRFIDSPVGYKGQDFGLLPFGSGRRICPGMAMGMATVELVLLNLLYFFDWKLPDGMTDRDIDIEEAGTLTVVKKVPLKLVPVLHSLEKLIRDYEQRPAVVMATSGLRDQGGVARLSQGRKKWNQREDFIARINHMEACRTSSYGKQVNNVSGKAGLDRGRDARRQGLLGRKEITKTGAWLAAVFLFLVFRIKAVAVIESAYKPALTIRKTIWHSGIKKAVTGAVTTLPKSHVGAYRGNESCS